MTYATDFLVIGGGPAGSTFGNLAARRGWNVVLLEKDEHPKFHIGESLLPMNIPIFESLGVLDKVTAIGVPKMGADFTIANSGKEHQTFHFANALGRSPDHAFEVRRSEFDQVLFEQCRASGVDVRQQAKVTRVERLENGNHKVTAVDASGTEQAWETKYVVDASGRDTFLSGSRGWKRANPKHASAAVFGHFRGVKRRSGSDQGNISIYWFDHGWVWMIPLRDDIMSIGAVCYPDYLRTRRASLDEFLLETLNSISEVRARMEDSEPANAAQATGNYSYVSSRMTGPGYIMIGDAFAFIDPVFSSGVYLAMSSAASAVDVGEAWIRGRPLGYRLACFRHERMMARGIAAFSWFIYRFTTPAMRFLMSNPRNSFRVVEGVISMLAGDVFSNRAVRSRLLVFRIIYAVAAVFEWREGLSARRRRRQAVRRSEQEIA